MSGVTVGGRQVEDGFKRFQAVSGAGARWRPERERGRHALRLSARWRLSLPRQIAERLCVCPLHLSYPKSPRALATANGAARARRRRRVGGEPAPADGCRGRADCRMQGGGMLLCSAPGMSVGCSGSCSCSPARVFAPVPLLCAFPLLCSRHERGLLLFLLVSSPLLFSPLR